MAAYFRERGLGQGMTAWLLTNLRAGDGGFTWRFDRDALAALHDRTRNTDLWPLVDSTITDGGLPARCIRGGRSGFVPDAEAQRMRAAGMDIATLVDAGHFVHVDALAELVTLLRDWDGAR